MIFQLQFPLNLCSSWLTNDHLDLIGPKTTSPRAGDVLTDYLVADQVAVTEMPGKRFIVCREELTVPFEGMPYLRYLLLDVADTAVPPWLAFTGPPPGGAAAGPSCSGAVQLVFGGPVGGSVVLGTEDWWKFDAVAGVSYDVALSGVVGSNASIQVMREDCLTGHTVAVAGNWTHNVVGPTPGESLRVRIAGQGNTSYSLVVNPV
jgi:hypothetical protein